MGTPISPRGVPYNDSDHSLNPHVTQSSVEAQTPPSAWSHPARQLRPPPIKRRLLHPHLGAVRPNRQSTPGMSRHHPPPRRLTIHDPLCRNRHRYLRWSNGSQLDAAGDQIEDAVRRTDTQFRGCLSKCAHVDRRYRGNRATCFCVQPPLPSLILC